jgi:hypothetical protein
MLVIIACITILSFDVRSSVVLSFGGSGVLIFRSMGVLREVFIRLKWFWRYV